MTKQEKQDILKKFKLDLFSLGTGGLGSWISVDTDERVFKRLEDIERDPLTKVQFNQLLAFGHEAPVSDDFFKYYWLENPTDHPYKIWEPSNFDPKWTGGKAVQSIEHLKWGLYRLYTDGLLYFGNIRTAFRQLRDKTEAELKLFFEPKRFDTETIKTRGPALDLLPILQDDRYLISEMACKSYGDHPKGEGELRKALVQAFKIHKRKGGGGRIKIKRLLEEDNLGEEHADMQQIWEFGAQDVLEEEVGSEEEIEEKYKKLLSVL